MVRRFVVAEGLLEQPGVLVLDGDVASHLRDVLRSRVGDRVELSDGTGWVADAELVGFSKGGVTVSVSERRVLEEPAGPFVSLLQCVAKGDKVDQIVRQSVELGVRAFVPVLSERSVGEKRSRTERWRAIAEDSIRVSGRAHRARIDEVVSFDELISRPRAALSLCFALGDSQGLAAFLSKTAVPASVEILVGPEGGLTEDEVSRAVSAGFVRVHLGAHTLRTETAGPAIVAMIMYWAGTIAG